MNFNETGFGFIEIQNVNYTNINKINQYTNQIQKYFFAFKK